MFGTYWMKMPPKIAPGIDATPPTTTPTSRKIDSVTVKLSGETKATTIAPSAPAWQARWEAAVTALGLPVYEGYGLSVGITSTLVMLTIANFGLASGLQNALLAAAGVGDRARQRELFSTVSFALLGICPRL